MKIPAPAYRLSLILAPLLLVTACSPNKDSEADNGGNLNAPILDNMQQADGNTAAVTVDNQSNAAASLSEQANEAQSKDRIPLALRGRWGLAAADCTSKNGNTKGLVEISGTVLSFYESRGKLASIIEWTPRRLHAHFSFQGEGMSWNREMELDLEPDGKVLIRRDHGEDAIPGPMRYRRCGA